MMIIRFTLENWRSFRDRATLSMVASRERQHRERLPALQKYGIRVLPITAIYGGNASGKTNFFRALHFMKELVVEGTRPNMRIPVKPYVLDPAKSKEPAFFSIELLADETIYEFSFAVTNREIVEEKLVQIRSASERILYHRVDGKITFHSSLKNDEQYLEFVFRGTRDNQLFLTNSISQKVDNFRAVYDWFADSLELVAPDSRFAPFEHFFDEGHPMSATINQLLPQLDTGITGLGGKEIPIEQLTIPATLLSEIHRHLEDGESVRIISPTQDRYVFTKKEGELSVKKLVAFHVRSSGDRIPFDISDESDGTQRIIDLLPVLLQATDAGARKVYIIDEIDRSLHTLLTYRLLQAYLSQCSPESRTQLLFTTHDVLLMDQRLLRRDEMWVTERDSSGNSTLYSFSEYKDVRKDKDIRRSYLQGRMGGIPKIQLPVPFLGDSNNRRQDGKGNGEEQTEI